MGQQIVSAYSTDNKAQLLFRDPNHKLSEIRVDHVIAATGYKADVNGISFLDTDIKDQLALIGNTPRLSKNFESSVEGIYFAGPSTVNNFGPLMRFALGAGYASKKISQHLASKLEIEERSAKGQQATVNSQYQR